MKIFMRAIIIYLLLFPLAIFSQILDNFNDGNFTGNPVWIGDSLNWTVIDGELRSNSINPSSDFYLSTASANAFNCQWDFFVNLQLQTSSANYTDLYLISDSSNVKDVNSNGYFVRIGNTADEISLYKQINGITTKIIDGIDATVNSSNNRIDIKIIRNANHEWKLYSNTEGNGFACNIEGTVIDSSIVRSNYFGIFVQQSTSTFHLNHYYDNIYIGPIVYDTIAPAIISTTVISATEVDISFSETVELMSAELVNNYSTNNAGNPITAIRDENNFNTVHLTFANSFTDSTLNTISISTILDLIDFPQTISRKKKCFGLI